MGFFSDAVNSIARSGYLDSIVSALDSGFLRAWSEGYNDANVAISSFFDATYEFLTPTPLPHRESGVLGVMDRVADTANRVSGALIRGVVTLAGSRTHAHGIDAIGTAVGENSASLTLIAYNQSDAETEFPTAHTLVNNPWQQVENWAAMPTTGTYTDIELWANDPAEAIATTLETAAGVTAPAALAAYGAGPIAANSMTVGEFAATTAYGVRAVGRGLTRAGESILPPPGGLVVTPSGAAVVMPVPVTEAAVGALAPTTAGGSMLPGAGAIGISLMAATEGNTASPGQIKDAKHGPRFRGETRFNQLMEEIEGKNYTNLAELEREVLRLLDKYGSESQWRTQPWSRLRRFLTARRRCSSITGEDAIVSARIEQALIEHGGASSSTGGVGARVVARHKGEGEPSRRTAPRRDDKSADGGMFTEDDLAAAYDELASRGWSAD